MEMMLVKRISTELKETESDVRGVLQASLLEAWGGFAADRFPARESAKALMGQIDARKEEFSSTDLDLLMSTLEFSLRELGPEELETITGYDYSFGATTLAEVKKFAKEQG
jgi:hypothetical protein